MVEELKLSTPWSTYQKKVWALFSYDDEIRVGDLEEIDGGYLLEIYVDDPSKAFVLSQLVKPEIDFGNVKAYTKVVLMECSDYINMLQTAFKDNMSVRDIASKPFPGGKAIYVRFNPEIVQFKNDDLSDYSGNFTDLIAHVANDVLDLPKVGGARACTVDLTENKSE